MHKIITILILFKCADIYSQCWANMSLGGNSTIIIDENDNMFACGLNYSWQLGIGSTYFSTDTLVEVLPKSNWKNISCGNFHTLAIRNDGTLWAWGKNEYGQLGNGTTQNQATPIQIGIDTDWDETNTGYHFSVAKKKNGTLWAWGRNLFGQLGLGDKNNRLIPTKISNAIWKKFTTGNVHILAIKDDGTLWAWGNSYNGQVGDGSTNESILEPKMISSNSDWMSISSEGLHTLAIKGNGTLWAWGNNINGTLGIDSMITSIKSPIQVGNESNWRFINTSESNSAAIKKDGTLWIWGGNEYGQLGFEDSLAQFTPLKFNTDEDWYSISMGLFHMGAIKIDNSLYTWGRNNIGQLGIGNTIDSNIPSKIQCTSIINSYEMITQNEESYLFPNPAIQEVNYFSKKDQILHFFNMFGVEVGKFEVHHGINYLDISNLVNGSYFIISEIGERKLLEIIR
jgi:alpha-tubulin suppressor-like RCC1 family protein